MKTSPKYRIGKKWRDPDLEQMLLDFRVDGNRLVVMLVMDALRARRRDGTIQNAQWKVGDEVYETTCTMVMPARGVMQVWAVVAD